MTICRERGSEGVVRGRGRGRGKDKVALLRIPQISYCIINRLRGLLTWCWLQFIVVSFLYHLKHIALQSITIYSCSTPLLRVG